MSDLKISKKRGRRPRESTSGRESILRVAQRHFGISGFEGVSLRGIAREAEVDVALIVHTFHSKLGLWKAILETLHHDLEAHEALFEFVRSEASVQERLAAFIDWFCDRCLQAPYFYLIVLQESPQSGERFNLIVELLLLPLLRQLRPLMSDAIAAGYLPQCEAEEAFLLVLNTIAVHAGTQGLLIALRAERRSSGPTQVKQIAKELFCQCTNK